jgi:hypothetical protein
MLATHVRQLKDGTTTVEIRIHGNDDPLEWIEDHGTHVTMPLDEFLRLPAVEYACVRAFEQWKEAQNRRHALPQGHPLRSMAPPHPYTGH